MNWSSHQRECGGPDAEVAATSALEFTCLMAKTTSQLPSTSVPETHWSPAVVLKPGFGWVCIAESSAWAAVAACAAFHPFCDGDRSHEERAQYVEKLLQPGMGKAVSQFLEARDAFSSVAPRLQFNRSHIDHLKQRAHPDARISCPRSPLPSLGLLGCGIHPTQWNLHADANTALAHGKFYRAHTRPPLILVPCWHIPKQALIPDSKSE